MIDYGDYVVLGRVPVVARMLGSSVPASGLQWGDVLLTALAIAAAVWGFAVGVSTRRNRPDLGMLAIGGSAVYLASVLIAGFGYGYKAAFLLLVVPLASLLVGANRRAFVFAGLSVVLLVGIESVVVWNTVLVTVAGLVAAGFGAGAGLAMIIRSRPRWTVTRSVAAA
jgi:hypothetical protein